MAFHNIRLDPVYSYGATGGPETNIQIQSPSGGYESRIDFWGADRGRWDFAFDLIELYQVQALLAFFKARRGPLFSFKFQAPNDFQAVTQPLVTPTSGLTMQLQVTYADTVNPIVRTVTKIATDQQAVTLTKNGSPYTTFTVDPTTGIVTLTADTFTSEDVFAWYNLYDTIVRFDMQQFKGTEADFNEGAWDGISVVEVWGEG